MLQVQGGRGSTYQITTSKREFENEKGACVLEGEGRGEG